MKNSSVEKNLSIINACRSIDEKLNELYNSYRWADSKEEKEQAELLYEYYRFVIKQLRTDVEGSLYVWNGTVSDFTGKASSYNEFIESIGANPPDFTVERYIPTEQGQQKLIAVDFTMVDGILCENGFALNKTLAQADFAGTDIEKFNKAEQLLDKMTK